MTEAGLHVAPPRLVPHDARTEGFALGVDEPLSLGIRRIVRDEVDRCVDLIRNEPDIDETAHEMRKALKRVRAVLRLMRGELGRFRYREENVVLRDVARRWAPVRDGAVLARVATSVVTDTDVVGEVLGRRLVTTLDRRADAARAAVAADRRLHIDTLTTLLCFRARVDAFPVVGDGAFPDTFGAVRPGFARIARRASNGMATADAVPTAHHLHEWRKNVKYLRHQVEVLQPCWDDLFGAVAERLSLLGDALGDDHDLAELGTLVAGDPTLVPDERWRDRLLTAVEHRRRPLQDEALALGGTVLRSPGTLVDLVEAAWAQARSGPPRTTESASPGEQLGEHRGHLVGRLDG